ncbi:uncharacterized protein LOC113465226 [Ceratina calcarata]|uniref:Uncharacterized protein LOC113465226 n=1 Tax=Ceratina calcarata TaxID=156304 RepID=A0AAJ7SC82_9HYME|nr:uncharacterized protein LOC113465226 [Ceratina calcarata]
MVCHEWMRPFRKLIHTQISFLNYSSLGGVDPNRSTFVKFLYLSYKVWMLTMMNIFAITILADIYVNWNKLSVTTDDGCIFAGIVVVIFKAIIHQARRKDMIRLLNDILNCADDLCEFSGRYYCFRCVVSRPRS